MIYLTMLLLLFLISSFAIANGTMLYPSYREKVDVNADYTYEAKQLRGFINQVVSDDGTIYFMDMYFQNKDIVLTNCSDLGENGFITKIVKRGNKISGTTCKSANHEINVLSPNVTIDWNHLKSVYDQSGFQNTMLGSLRGDSVDTMKGDIITITFQQSTDSPTSVLTYIPTYAPIITPTPKNNITKEEKNYIYIIISLSVVFTILFIAIFIICRNRNRNRNTTDNVYILEELNH